MAEKRKLEFFLLRYVPDAVKGEFVNFGLVAIENGAGGAKVADVRFMKDQSRLLCFDPHVDLDVLMKLQEEIRREVGSTTDQAALLLRMEDSFSGAIQISPTMPAFTERIADEEIENVARIFLDTPKVRRGREPVGRRRILGTMQDAWEQAGVAAWMRPFPVAPYTRAGDPFTFDFGYRVGGEIKLFHALSMRSSVDAAVLLAARFPKIAEAMLAAKDALVPALTAVVDDGLDRNEQEIGFALGMMEETQIRIAAVGEMARIAETARVELRA